MTDKPVAVGFGISTPEQACSVGEIADGVIIGSALIKVAADSKDHTQAAGQFVQRMVTILDMNSK